MISNPYIPEGVDKETEDILLQAYTDTAYFCKVFMPKTFTREFSPAHRQVFKALDDDSIQKLVIALPRGWGKTSIINKAYPAKKILFRDRNYIVPISATGASAIEFSENLKNELLTNEDITDIFGPIRSRSIGDEQGAFSTLEWVTDSGIKILPRGAGQQIRGRLFRDHRPDLFIVDDIDDDEAVESEERREKLKKWFMSALKNSVDYSQNWRIVVVGTVLHEDSLLSNLLDPDQFKDWTKLRFELCDDDCRSNWPEYLNDTQCQALHDEYDAAGMLDAFFREHRNIPVPTVDPVFSNIQYYNDIVSENELNKDSNVITAVLCDPAKTMKTGSARTAVVAVGVDTIKNRWYIRDVVDKQMRPDDLYAEMFAMAERTNALIMAPLVTSLNEYILQPLQNEMGKRGKHYIIVEVKERQPKTGPKRSAGLIPLYRNGHVYHNRAACRKLIDYLKMWPRPAHWDAIDALAGMLFVLEEGERYFTSSEDPETTEEEYDELENEEALEVFNMV